MAIPNFQTIMLPMLKLLADGRTWSIGELTHAVSDHFNLTPEEREHRVSSGQMTVIANRTSWTRMHLRNAGLIHGIGRNPVRITELGRSVVTEPLDRIDVKFLARFPAYQAYRDAKAQDRERAARQMPEAAEEEQTPHDMIESAYQSLRRATAEELIGRLKSCSPSFFENVVLRLLMAMGYGGLGGHGNVTGKSGDGGIDGVIRQDKLGLDAVCIQAKRWDGPVGRPVVQQFVGSMDYYRAKKGVILTTSSFTKDGAEFLQRIEGKTVVLVDGDRLAELMIDHGLGVTTTNTYAIKEVSNDFFDEDEF